MKKITLYVDEKYADAAIVGLIGNDGKNITSFTIPIEKESIYKVRGDGKLTNLRMCVEGAC